MEKHLTITRVKDGAGSANGFKIEIHRTVPSLNKLANGKEVFFDNASSITAVVSDLRSLEQFDGFVPEAVRQWGVRE